MTQPVRVTPVVNQLVVIGLGLIGGSLAIAARERGVAKKVIGVARRAEVCTRAIELGVVDEATTQLREIAPSLGHGDVIFIAVPTLTVASVLNDVHRHVNDEVTITDGASVKGSVANDVKRIWGAMPKNVVLGHPIAGSEKSGVEAANPTLYDHHRVILTPSPETANVHTERVSTMWQSVGAQVLQLGIKQHDEILAATSHLPHVIAYSLVDTLAHDSQNQDIFRYAAGGFRDFTRIASSDATMWRDIMLANKQAILDSIDLFSKNLTSLRAAIHREDAQDLMGVFTRAKSARDHFTTMLNRRAYTDSSVNANVTFRVTPGEALQGTAIMPGDQSISHRAIMLGSIAEGQTQISGFMEGEDALATLQAFRDMGVVIEGPHQGCVIVYGVGLLGLQKPATPIYAGNSGTSMRLLAGVLAAQNFNSQLLGSQALNARPMTGVIEPLVQMGGQITGATQGTAPLNIMGGKKLKGVLYALPVASAQIKSSVLLAGLYAEGDTSIIETRRTRDHTERMLGLFGGKLTVNENTVLLAGGQTLTGTKVAVPGDVTAATYFIVAALVAPGSSITLKDVGVNPTRMGAIDLLKSLGANISLLNERQLGAEPVADICVQASTLRSGKFTGAQLSAVVDELPALLIAAACSQGVTVITGVKQLQEKEPDRISAMKTGLQVLGIKVVNTENTMEIHGGVFSSCEVESFGDHRVALAFAVAGLKVSGGIVVNNCSSVVTSFPTFAATAQGLGISLEVFNS